MDELQKAGARIYVGHSISNLEGNTASSLPNAVVISSAIPVENEEVAYAKLLGIPMFVFPLRFLILLYLSFFYRTN